MCFMLYSVASEAGRDKNHSSSAQKGLAIPLIRRPTPHGTLYGENHLWTGEAAEANHELALTGGNEL